MAQTHSLDLELSSNQYASAADAAAFDITGAMTLEAWIKLESQPASDTLMAILSKWNASGNQRSFTLSYRDVSGTKNLVFLCTTDGSSSTGISFNITLQTGVWYHIAFSCNANNSPRQASLYVNGQAVVSDDTFTVASGIFSGSAPVLVGCILDGATVNNPFDGLIKDARIFNDRRTQAEIVADAHTQNVSDGNLVGEWNFNNSYADTSGGARDMSGTNSPTFSTDHPWEDPTGIDGSTYLETNLSAYWPLDEASGNRADSTAGAHTLTDNNTVGSAAGILSNGADFERDNSEYLSTADHADFEPGTVFSVSFWIKMEVVPTGGGNYSLFNKGSSGSANQAQYVLNYQESGGSVQFSLFTSPNLNGSGATDTNLVLSPALSTSVFEHIVITYNAGRVCFYRNGILLSIQTSAATSIANGSQDFRIGAGSHNGTLGSYMDGIMDEFAFYKRELHYGDILDLYNAGAALPYLGSVQYDQDVIATSTVSASMLTPKIMIAALNASAAVSASIANVNTFVRELAATATATASVLKGLAMEISATASITATTLAQRAYLVAMEASTAVSASVQSAVGKLLEATSSVSSTIEKTFSVSQLVSATATITATLEAGREKVLEATTAITATITTAIGKTLEANVSIVARLLAPFYKTKYPAHGDGDEYEVKYPHDTI